MPRSKKAATPEVSPQTEHWMKGHTREDMRSLVQELSDLGEDVTDVAKAIEDLETVEAEEEEWERTHVTEDDE